MQLPCPTSLSRNTGSGYPFQLPGPACNMDGQAVASSFTELGYQAVTQNYGLETQAIRNFKVCYVYSEEDDAAKKFMFDVKKLDCGHGHMGKFFHCSSCRSTKCLTCWMSVRDPVINELLSAWIADVDYLAWVNTCRFCPPENADKRCPDTCPGRRKFYFSSTQGVVPESTAWSCDCAACRSMTAAFQTGQPVE